MEPFCARKGGAIAKNVANIMRHDSSRVVACQSSDNSWGFSTDRVLALPLLRQYARLKGRRGLPLAITRPFFRKAFQPLLNQLAPSDMVWLHNQPFFGAAISEEIHKRGAKLVYHCHDPIAIPSVMRALPFLNADAYVFVSAALQRYWESKLPQMRNAFSIHNGADENMFFPLRDKDPVVLEPCRVLYVGRLHPEKGVQHLIKAVRILGERKVSVSCDIVGSAFSGGTKPTAFVRRIQRSAPKTVAFRGYRSALNVADEYRNADIVCCPSVYFEAFGNVNIEAMACGVPVVASRTGGIPEIAQKGGILLVDPGSAEQIADAIQDLIQQPRLYAETSRQGRSSYLAQFTWPSIVKQYHLVAETVLRG